MLMEVNQKLHIQNKIHIPYEALELIDCLRVLFFHLKIIKT